MRRIVTTVKYIQIAVIIMGFVSLASLLLSLTTLGKQNNSYLRTMVCISSVTPTQRTPDYVKSCYNKAEQHNRNVIDRFGNGR